MHNLLYLEGKTEFVWGILVQEHYEYRIPLVLEWLIRESFHQKIFPCTF